MGAAMQSPASAPLALAIAVLSAVAVAAAHAAPTFAIVGGLETSLLDGRQTTGQGQQGQIQNQGAPQGRPTTARLERVYSSSAKGAKGGARPAADSYARTGNRVHLSPAGPGALSENPAPCAVAGRHFLHGQQVTRPDPCELCVCLDGEVFCWWQDCPPSSAQGPCRGRPAFSSCQDDSATSAAAATATATPAPAAASGDGAAAAAATVAAAAPAASEQASSAETDGDVTQNETSAASTLPSAASAGAAAAAAAAAAGPDATPASNKGQQPLQATGATQDATTNPQAAGDQHASSGTETAPPATGPEDGNASSASHVTANAVDAANATTTSSPTTTELMCHVLGSTYRVGEVLPRDTGSCLQCECSPVGRVTCSPKDCLSVREEEDVYQPASSLDMFDVDSF